MVKIMQAHAVAAAQAADEEEERTFRNASGNSGDFSDDDSSSSESSSSDDDDGHGSSDAGEGGAEFDAAMEGLGELDEEELAGMTDEQLLARLMPKQAAATSATKVKTAKLYGRKALLAAHDTAFKQSAVEKAVAVKEKARAEKKRKQRDESAAQETAPLPVFKNRQRVMLLCSRGITERFRHFMKDLEALLPHARKDSKFDSKGNVQMLNELADLNDCNNTLYLEVRKHTDLYLWASKTPHGPCCKFLVQNVHTMDELKLTGNCLKGSRPLLSFDATFETEPQYGLIKELLVQMFGTPKGHRKSKPFFDHIFSFTIADGKIWFRNYQIVDKDPAQTTTTKPTDDDMTLVEIGPRFVMTPIRLFGGSFGGPTLWENTEFVSPNAMRAAQRNEGVDRYVSRVRAEHDRKRRAEASVPERTELDDVDEIFRQ